MDFSHYSNRPVGLAVALVNTADIAANTDHLATPDDLDTFIASQGEGWDPPTRASTRADLDRVRAIRMRLREVFEAGDESAAASLLNGILADVGAVPRLSVHGVGPHLHFEPEGRGVDQWLGAIASMGLVVALVEGGYERFGVCESAACDDVFIDQSRNRSKRHCSETCTTRESVAAYRRRRRGG